MPPDRLARRTRVWIFYRKNGNPSIRDARRYVAGWVGSPSGILRVMNPADPTTSLALPVAGALVAAVLFAVANNAQRHAASAVPQGRVGPVGLLLRLLRNPRWLAGRRAARLALLGQAGGPCHGRGLRAP